MILFSQASGKAGGILKIFALIGGLIITMLRTCGSKMDDVGRLAKNSDELYGLSHADDVLHAAHSGSKIDDLYSLSESVIQTRLRNFEIIHLDDLDETSPLRKAFESTKSYPARQQLQAMQTELLPPRVRTVLSEPGGEELYAAMMGRKLTSTEANALRELYGIPFKATDEAAEGYVYLKKTPYANETDDINELNRRAYNDMIVEPKSGISEVDISTTSGSQSYANYSDEALKEVITEKKVLVEKRLSREVNLKLLKTGLKVLHHANSFSHLMGHKSNDLLFWIYEPSSDSVFMNHYQVDKKEMQLLRSSIKKLDKKEWITVVKNREDITALLSKRDKVIFGIYNFDYWPDELNILPGSERLKRAGMDALPSTSRLNIGAYSVLPLDTTIANQRRTFFEPLIKALVEIKVNDRTSANDFIEDLANRYASQIEKLSNDKMSAIVTINAVGGGRLFEVEYVY
jgi:hypothetical protein